MVGLNRDSGRCRERLLPNKPLQPAGFAGGRAAIREADRHSIGEPYAIAVVMISTCSFETSRLRVREWQSILINEWNAKDLSAVVCALLTERVTAPLPSAWHGPYSPERARRWIEARDLEGSTFLIVNKADGEPLGLMFLSESATDDASNAAKVDVRLGYLLAESAWGNGLATELVQGFANWCRRGRVSSIIGGVGRDNLASRRVLEKNGFVRALADDAASEDHFVLRLSSET